MRATFIGIGERATTDFKVDTYECQFVCIGKQRGSYLAQGVKALDDGIEHHDQMNPPIESFCVLLATINTAKLKDF